MPQIKYQISGSANTAPIAQTAGAIDTLATTSTGVQDAFMGLEAASRGSTTAIFSLARGVKGLIASIKAGQMAVPWMLAISVAIMAVTKAWDWYKGRQEAASKAAQEAQDKFVNLIQRLRELRKVTQEALTLDSYNKQLEGLSKHFQDAAEKAKRLADNAAALRQVKVQQQLAAVDAETAGKLTGNAANDAAVNLAADRRRQEIQVAAELADLEARRAELADQRARAEQQIKYFEGARKTAQAQIQRSAGRVQAAEQNLVSARGNIDEQEKAKKALDAQRAEHQKLVEAEAARQKVIDATVAAQRDVLNQLVAENGILDENVKLVEAQRKAREAELALREKQLTAAEGDRARQAQIADLKKKQAEAQKAADAQAEASAARIAKLRDIEAKAGEAYAEGRKKITDPAYARQQRMEEREKARDERQWNAKVARAERAAARGGPLTKDTKDILEAARNQKLAAAAGKTAQTLEQKMAQDMTESKTSLKNIEQKIEKLLTMS